MGKENLHLDNQCSQVVFFFLVVVFSKRNRKHVLRVSIEFYKNTLDSLGELKKAVETLAYGSCSHCFSRSPKHPLVFLYLDRNRVHVFYFFSMLIVVHFQQLKVWIKVYFQITVSYSFTSSQILNP